MTDPIVLVGDWMSMGRDEPVLRAIRRGPESPTLHLVAGQRRAEQLRERGRELSRIRRQLRRQERRVRIRSHVAWMLIFVAGVVLVAHACHHQLCELIR